MGGLTKDFQSRINEKIEREKITDEFQQNKKAKIDVIKKKIIYGQRKRKEIEPISNEQKKCKRTIMDQLQNVYERASSSHEQPHLVYPSDNNVSAINVEDVSPIVEDVNISQGMNPGAPNPASPPPNPASSIPRQGMSPDVPNPGAGGAARPHHSEHPA